MRIIRLQTTGFKRVKVVDVTPGDGLVEVRGNNAEGKTSLLDSIMAALGGADAAPVKPIKTGEEYAAIRVTLGDGQPDLVVTKYFDEVGEKLRVETGDGAEFKAGQTKLDDLLGRMTFDPLAFARMPAKDQAAELRRIVPITVKAPVLDEEGNETGEEADVPLDLEKLAALDKADVAARRDINRDGHALKARLGAINISGIIPPRPDREAIVAKLSTAGETNSAIERERSLRFRRDQAQSDLAASVKRLREEAERLIAQANDQEREFHAEARAINELPPLDEPVDTAKLSEDLAKADADLALLARVDERKALEAQVEAERARSAEYTARIEARAKVRADALAAAKMPVEGLSIAEVEGEMLVTFNGEPFSQSSGAEQLRVSMALAMAANPKLRVMLIKDGSLLDENGLALVREMAKAGEYQVWLESVGAGDGSGIIMEAGKVRGAGDVEPIPGPKRRKAKEDEPTGEQQEQAAELSRATSPLPGDVAQTAVKEPEPVKPKPERPRAMREFTTPAQAGDLFGGSGK